MTKWGSRFYNGHVTFLAPISALRAEAKPKQCVPGINGVVEWVIVLFYFTFLLKKENKLVQLICKHIGGKLGVGGGSILGLKAAFR